MRGRGDFSRQPTRLLRMSGIRSPESPANKELSAMAHKMTIDIREPAYFWPDYSAPPSPPEEDQFFCVFLGTYPATPERVEIRDPRAPWDNPTCARIHKGLQYSDKQRVGIVDLVEWYHPNGSSRFKFPAIFAISQCNVKEWERRLESDITIFLEDNPGKKPLLIVSPDAEKALGTSIYADTIKEVENDSAGAEPRASTLEIAGVECLALLCAHPSPRSLRANERDDNDQTRTDRELALVRLAAKGLRYGKPESKCKRKLTRIFAT